MFKAAWKQFNTQFQHLLDDLKRHKALLINQASLSQIEQSQVEQAHTRLQFSMIKKTVSEQRYLSVIAWLSGINPTIDHEAALAARIGYPSTGRWLLQERQLLTWLNPNNSLVPIIWMNGIPGVGQTSSLPKYPQLTRYREVCPSTGSY